MSTHKDSIRHPRNLESVCKYNNHPFLNGVINPSSFDQTTKRQTITLADTETIRSVTPVNLSLNKKL